VSSLRSGRGRLEEGKSILFLLEANPGPGLGLLLAYTFFGRATPAQSPPARRIIHFFGGIHEIYFPYVLMNPRLLLAVIAGGMTRAKAEPAPAAAPVAAPVAADETGADDNAPFRLRAENIHLGLSAASKEDAIRFAGAQLVQGGYVEPSYVDAMLAREQLTSTYLGESIAVPHGTSDAKDAVKKTGVIVCQYPQGVRFGDDEDDIARLVIAIAARNNEHLDVIAAITGALNDDAVIAKLTTTGNVDEVLKALNPA
jgi:mannitol PTS system EIICBA or EIICB component